MTASSAPCMAPPFHGESRAAGWWRVLGACLLAALFLLLAASCDACVLPPPFEAMEPINPKPYYDIGEKVEYKCKKGYLRQPFYLMVATCEKNHSWVPITDDGCIKIKCKYLNPPPNGRVDYINGTHTWGDQVRFSCVEGFYVSGNEALNCELKGDKVDWNGRVPTCEKVLCSPPPKIKNGKYTFSDVQVFKYFEAVTYSCDAIQGPDKLSLVGNEVLYCAGHRKWSSAAPECKVVKCPLPVVENGKQISGFGQTFLYQATVTFQCSPGFYFNGSDTVFCDSDNAWKPSVPQCLKGPKPTHPTKPPVYNYPGYPNPREGLFDPDFKLWIFILIILIAVLGLAVILLCLWRLFERQKKSRQTVMPTIQNSDHLRKPRMWMPSFMKKPMKR